VVLTRLAKYFIAFSVLFYSEIICFAQPSFISPFTAADTLRGSNNANRNWWNVIRYDLSVFVDIENESIFGGNIISFTQTTAFEASKKMQTMQIDLQDGMQIESAFMQNILLDFVKKESIYLINIPTNLLADGNNITNEIRFIFSGSPRKAVSPPWDGGLIWKQDNLKRPFVSVACQGLGASVWYPCKDIQSDEPDSGATIKIICADTLTAVANGKLVFENKSEKFKKCKEYTWKVSYPINNYNLVFYIGKYVSFHENYKGLNGNLDCSFYVLDYEIEKAKTQFTQTKNMLTAFEHWFGAFPWYNDGYKLVQAPHLGMEHQSAIAYGNKFENGYLGRDLSGTGVGKNWDYILVHESGHEWWGNNITTADIADMWIHEGFTCYSEALFCDYMYGKEAGNKYVQGLRKNIQGREPLVSTYGVNSEPTGDIYYKGANLLHTIRTVINNDSLFRSMLITMQIHFKQQIVTSKLIENFIISYSGINFKPLFAQYIYTNELPILQYKISNKNVQFQFVNCNDDFQLPIRFSLNQEKETELLINTQKKKLPLSISKKQFRKMLNNNYYFNWQEL
jgi:aminopeptidase N